MLNGGMILQQIRQQAASAGRHLMADEGAMCFRAGEWAAAEVDAIDEQTDSEDQKQIEPTCSVLFCIHAGGRVSHVEFGGADRGYDR